MSNKIGSVMIVGGGVSGIQSALDLANSGFKVYMVEKTPSIGGNMARLDKTFPTNDCSICILSPKMVEAARHPNIELLINSEVVGVEGGSGNFEVTVNKRASFVDPDKCIACNLCVDACPVKVPDEFNMGLSKRKAIYIPFPQAIPSTYHIDKDHCLEFRTFVDKTGKVRSYKCKRCVSVCPRDAPQHDEEPEKTLKLNVGSIILSPGYELLDPTVLSEYGYGTYPNVLTSLQYERLLCSSGPTEGHLKRPSDGKVPDSVAFIQCVCSRDVNRGVGYCSSFCCTYSIKESILTKDHHPETKAKIFYIDMRTYGKEFEYYYERAKDMYGVEFIRSKVAEISEDPETRNLFLRYVDETGEIREEEFDLVVLAVGIKTTEETRNLAKTLGVELEEHDFCKTSPFTPMSTSSSGIFATGPFVAPMDIPESVAQASGAASKAAGILAPARGTLVTEKVYPPERDVSGEEPRIGVWVCHCGGNIGNVVDVSSVVDYVKDLPNVIHAQETLYACSFDSIDQMMQVVGEKNLNRVVVASCSPRTHEPLFQESLQEEGLNPYLFQMVNIREHCSWVHSNEPEKATFKAKELTRMAIAKAALNKPLYKTTIEVTPVGLVIGGGASGMTAALELASQGFEVHLVEKEAELGGNLRSIHYLKGDYDPQEFLRSTIDAVSENEKIRVYTEANIVDVSGAVGEYNVKIDRRGEETLLKVGSIIVAVGAEEHKPVGEYLYGKNGNVLTLLEFDDRLHKGEVDLDNVAFIQCVGSRIPERPHCSRICCTHAVMSSLEIKKRNPDANVYILYRDLRTYGFNEDLYAEALEKGVLFIRYDVEEEPEVSERDGALQVNVKDQVLGEVVSIPVDTLILSSATIPREDNKVLKELLKVPLNVDGFFFEAHMKLRPVDFAVEGMYLCGLAHSPKALDESIAQACAAAQRASIILSKKTLEGGGAIAEIDEDLCTGCEVCYELCPFGAIEMIQKGIRKKARVLPVVCTGCGVCVANCPTGAADLHHFEREQIRAEIDSLMVKA